MQLSVIARIHTPFKTKFAVPRQSGIADRVFGEIVFEPEYRSDDAIRGIEEWSHLWLIWQFSENADKDWSPTVRPPRLGGNMRVGVFATRSPFRPNPLGLSCVKLERVEHRSGKGTVLIVSGADLVDGTPIYDIKPYVPYADSHPDALGGFTDTTEFKTLTVSIDKEILNILPETQRSGLIQILENDPRPSYHDDPERIYGFVFAEHEIKFSVANDILKVISIEKTQSD